jgi:hypothetical protein
VNSSLVDRTRNLSSAAESAAAAAAMKTERKMVKRILTLLAEDIPWW